jgi:hypothetical protein
MCLAFAAAAKADPVIYWNEVTVAAVTAGRAGPPGLLDIALVQLAVHDAVQAIEGRFDPYDYDDVTKRGVGSPEAAVAAAAHRVLVLLYPAQQAALDAKYATYIADHGLAGDPGLAVGEAAGSALHAHQYRPVIPVTPYFGVDAPGQWRSAQPMAFLHLAFSKPFTLNRVDQFRPPPPPPMNSVRYAREFDEVKAQGSAASHPNDKTDMARFWSGNFVSMWNEALRQVAGTQLVSIGDRARLMALANLAGADGAMATWDAKYFYNFWRPSTAIHLADDDRNPRTICDPAWAALFGADPLYPDYVSGANGLTGAFTGLLAEVLGDDVPFSVKTTVATVTMKERHFSSFSEAASEVVEARILLGIHFRSADEEARRLGERVAHWTLQQSLKPRAPR